MPRGPRRRARRRCRASEDPPDPPMLFAGPRRHPCARPCAAAGVTSPARVIGVVSRGFPASAAVGRVGPARLVPVEGAAEMDETPPGYFEWVEGMCEEGKGGPGACAAPSSRLAVPPRLRLRAKPGVRVPGSAVCDWWTRRLFDRSCGRWPCVAHRQCGGRWRARLARGGEGCSAVWTDGLRVRRACRGEMGCAAHLRCYGNAASISVASIRPAGIHDHRCEQFFARMKGSISTFA